MHLESEFSKWCDFYRRVLATGTALAWPSETLVRLFRGSYIAGLPKDLRGLRCLDVGCGNGNNTVFLCSTGMEVSASEVSDGVCDIAKSQLAGLGFAVDVRTGTNRSLPFPDNTFDFLVSWNVVHYEPSSENIRDAFAEYARVLKPGGRVLLSTTGPEHKILRDAERVGPHRYRIGRADDFRRGQIFFYFDDPECLRDHLQPAFTAVEIGRTHDRLMSETLDWFVATAVKA